MSLFGEPVQQYKENPWKAPAITPFDFINAIHYTKDNLIVDDWSEKQYNPYIVNKGLSYGQDTIIPANEMNSRPHLDKILQFSFLINIPLFLKVIQRYELFFKKASLFQTFFNFFSLLPSHPL